MTDFYEKNATEFFTATVDVDMSPLYQKFLPLVPAGGHILDAGCGSGRDAKHFQDCGFEVTAMDASHALCELASEHTGQQAHCLRFNEITWQDRYDAVWACASLLHVPREELLDAFQRLGAALKPGGAMYVSFKYGETDRELDGRHFTDMNEPRIQELLADQQTLKVIESFITHDRRPDRDESWLNVLLTRPTHQGSETRLSSK